MLDLVDVGERSVEAYRKIAPDAVLDGLHQAAGGLRGARVLHLNATPYGGGVSELLRSQVPLLNDLGLVADWRIISGDETFFRVTKTIHNGLQGAAQELADQDKATYLANARGNATAFTEDYDFVFVHDPQPAAILPMRGKGQARWIWRCHIDTAAPNPQVWDFLRPFLADYDAGVFTLQEFVPPDCPIGNIEIMPPAIDPLSPKNMALDERHARQILEWIGVRLRQPLVTQVSRFDPWKDPMGVIEAYRLARRQIPELQLALVASLALDDPEGWDVYRSIRAEAKSDRRIHVFTNIIGVGNIEVNAFQSLSNVIVQKSIREGFGLVVSESLWKGTAVVAGRAGGIPLQMADGAGGILVDGVEECASALVGLLRNPAKARELGARGRERVREHFLMPRLVLNDLRLMQELIDDRPVIRPPDWMRHRDPTCGMMLGCDATGLSEIVDGTKYEFCSELCRARFLENPQHYLSAARHVPSGRPASDGPR